MWPVSEGPLVFFLMKLSGKRANGCGAPIAISVLVCLVAACGKGESKTVDPKGPAPTPTVDPLADAPCVPWQPSDADWSSLPTSRPARIASLTASPSGKYLYAVGSWVDAGIPTSQILRSADLGDTWCVVPTPSAVSQVAPSAASETTLFALSDGQPQSLLVTNDGGATWTATLTSPPSAASGRLHTSVTDPAALWFKGADTLGGNPWLVTRDSGATWTAPAPPELIAATDPKDHDALDTPYSFIAGLVVDPNTPDRLLEWGTVQTILMWESAPVPDRWFSSEDGGSTWRELNAPPAVPASEQFGISEPVFADQGSNLYLQTGSALLRSDDWGETWQALGPLPGPSARVTTFDSSKAGGLFAMSPPSVASGQQHLQIWNSSDEGSTWHVVPAPSDPGFLPLLSPAGQNVIVGLSDLGMVTTADQGKHWHQHGIIPMPSSLAQSPAAWQRLWATALFPSDTNAEGTRSALQSLDGGLNWTPISDVEGRLLMDGANADVALAELYDSSKPGRRTEDGGHTWSPFTLPQGGYITPLTACPSPASCAYVSVHDTQGVGCRLARTDDQGRSWNETPVPAELCSGAPSLAVSPDDPDQMVAACVSSICVSRDGGVTWKTTQSIGPNPDYYVTAIAFLHDNVVLASTGKGYAVDTQPPVLARSTDGGVTWKRLREISGHVFMVSNVRAGTVFLMGAASNENNAVYRSDDAGATWQLFPPSAGGPVGSTSFSTYSISDRVGGGFVAATSLGLLQFN